MASGAKDILAQLQEWQKARLNSFLWPLMNNKYSSEGHIVPFILSHPLLMQESIRAGN